MECMLGAVWDDGLKDEAVDKFNNQVVWIFFWLFSFFFLTQLVRHLFFAHYFEDFTISKAVFDTKGSPVFFLIIW